MDGKRSTGIRASVVVAEQGDDEREDDDEVGMPNGKAGHQSSPAASATLLDRLRLDHFSDSQLAAAPDHDPVTLLESREDLEAAGALHPDRDVALLDAVVLADDQDRGAGAVA